MNKLIQKCKANDHKAFEQLYKQFYRVLLGVALRYSGNRTEAEDVLQDAFIKIFHHIDSFNGKGSFEGWLKRIVQNTAINNYRANTKSNLYVEVSKHEEDCISDSSVNGIFDSFEVKDAVELLNSMPPGYRLVINLFFIDGYSHKEIAQMLNVSVGTSKSQLSKAKNYLKNLIELQSREKIS